MSLATVSSLPVLPPFGPKNFTFSLYINILLYVKKKNQYIVVFLKSPTSHPSSHSILNRVKTRLDVIRYQLSVIGFDKILINIVSHLYKEYSFAKGVKTNNH